MRLEAAGSRQVLYSPAAAASRPRSAPPRETAAGERSGTRARVGGGGGPRGRPRPLPPCSSPLGTPPTPPLPPAARNTRGLLHPEGQRGDGDGAGQIPTRGDGGGFLMRGYGAYRRLCAGFSPRGGLPEWGLLLPTLPAAVRAGRSVQPRPADGAGGVQAAPWEPAAPCPTRGAAPGRVPAEGGSPLFLQLRIAPLGMAKKNATNSKI